MELERDTSRSLTHFHELIAAPLKSRETTSARRLRLLRYYASAATFPTTDHGRRMRQRYEEKKRRGQIKPAGAGPCFCCGSSGERLWHHIIQLQHGGTNRPLNRVKVCEGCHAKIHPWLDVPVVELPEWASRPLWR